MSLRPLHPLHTPVLFGRKKVSPLAPQLQRLENDLSQLVAWDKAAHEKPVIRDINIPRILKQARAFLQRQADSGVSKAVPFMMAIGGGTAAGTTYTESKLIGFFKDLGRRVTDWRHRQNGPLINAMEMDDYYRDYAERRNAMGDARFFLETNLDAPKAFTMRKFFRDLMRIKNGVATRIPVYEKIHSSRMDGARLMTPTPFFLVEGLFPFGKKPLRQLFDLKLFVDTDESVREARWWKRAPSRNIQRDEAGLALFRNAFTRHNKNVAPTKAHADIVVDGGIEGPAYPETLRKLTRILLFHFSPQPQRAADDR